MNSTPFVKFYRQNLDRSYFAKAENWLKVEILLSILEYLQLIIYNSGGGLIKYFSYQIATW